MYEITDSEFKRMSGYIRENYGINLKEEKLSLITARLSGVLIQKNMDSFTEYFNYVISDRTGEAVTDLINRITTNHTFFMREVEHFNYFKSYVLPYLKNTVKDKDLRIWSAGCSTGEEPYTIAMILDEFFSREKFLWDTKVLATDISSNVLEKAEKGIFSNEVVLPLPAYWKQLYLDWYDDNNSIITDKLRNEVIFRKLNLMDEVFPFKRKFHVIFCRNVMIYFDNITRKNLINKFYDSLDDGGFLFIGHSESVNRGETNFKYIMPAVYRKE